MLEPEAILAYLRAIVQTISNVARTMLRNLEEVCDNYFLILVLSWLQLSRCTHKDRAIHILSHTHTHTRPPPHVARTMLRNLGYVCDNYFLILIQPSQMHTQGEGCPLAHTHTCKCACIEGEERLPSYSVKLVQIID